MRRMNRSPSIAECSVGRSSGSGGSGRRTKRTPTTPTQPTRISVDEPGVRDPRVDGVEEARQRGPDDDRRVHVAENSAIVRGRPPSGATIGGIERIAGAWNARAMP